MKCEKYKVWKTQGTFSSDGCVYRGGGLRQDPVTDEWVPYCRFHEHTLPECETLLLGKQCPMGFLS